MERVLLIGAGALARDILGVFGQDKFVATYVDPEFPTTPLGRLPIVASWAAARQLASHYVIAVSDVEHRRRAQRNAADIGLLPAPPLIARTAIVAADAAVAPGCLVGHFAVIGPSARLQENALVMHSAIVAHDSHVGSNTVLCAGVCLSGCVHIGNDCFVGPNSALAPGVQIGDGSFIAAGSSCFRNAAPGSRLIGSPARQIASEEQPAGDEKRRGTAR